MTARIMVNLNRLATLCSFIADAWTAKVIDDEAYFTLVAVIEANRGDYIDTEVVTVEHDPCGCPMLDEWLAHNKC